MDPIVLPANQPPDRFYRGGPAIARFRGHGSAGDSAPGDRVPEDWIGSVTCVRGQEPYGLTVLPSGQLLPDAVREDPLSWLGPAHVARYGADTRLLVKLLDAGQRLPVHAHPDDGFAAQHLGTAHGKAEAWYILSPGTVWLGLREDVSYDRWRQAVADQDAGWMLSVMHQVEVDAHDTVYVPPGTLHAIGQGVLLLEVQQPEDLSVLCEWKDFAIDGAAEGHLGLGFDVALRCVRLARHSDSDIRSLVRRGAASGNVLAPQSQAYFHLERVGPGAVALPAGFRILATIAGQARVSWAGGSLAAPRGTTILVPYGAGEVQVAGGEVLAASA